MVDYEMVKNKLWRNICESLEKGEEVRFTSDSEQELQSIRTQLYKWNTLHSGSFSIGMETDGLKICIYTKPKV